MQGELLLDKHVNTLLLSMGFIFYPSSLREGVAQLAKHRFSDEKRGEKARICLVPIEVRGSAGAPIKSTRKRHPSRGFLSYWQLCGTATQPSRRRTRAAVFLFPFLRFIAGY